MLKFLTTVFDWMSLCPSNLSLANFNSSCKVQLSHHLLQGVIPDCPLQSRTSCRRSRLFLVTTRWLAVSAPCCTLRSGTGSYSPLHPPCPDQYPTCVMNSKTVLVNESRISGINEAIQGCDQELRCWNQPAWVHLPFSTTYRLCDLGSFLGFSGSQSSQRLGELERSWPGSTQAFSSSSEYFF